jgi:hypothetical protein
MDYLKTAHKIYTGNFKVSSNALLGLFDFIEHEHSEVIPEERGPIFYASLISAMSCHNDTHWGRKIYRTRFDEVYEYCLSKLHPLAPITITPFESLLSDKGKSLSEELLSIYRGKKGKFVALGLMAMFYLNLTAGDPRKWNQANKCRILATVLGTNIDPRNLLINKYGDDTSEHFKSEIQEHVRKIIAVIE